MLLLDYWKDIPGIERHQASYSGKLRHLGKVIQRGRYIFDWVPEQMLDSGDNGTGYERITLTISGRQIKEYVHILVAKTFIPNPFNLPEVNHLNHIRWDNKVPNLEWCTHKQNMEYAAKQGRMKGRPKKPQHNSVEAVI